MKTSRKNSFNNKAVPPDIGAYERTREALALLRVVELRRRQVTEGKVKEMPAVFRELDMKIKRFKEKNESASLDCKMPRTFEVRDIYYLGRKDELRLHHR